ncbi:MAG: hypothetical protein A2857_00615 [Candidatus Levybacteria bacterium RIFCSPHIGHO2_01_FULL_36_15]|nr:MAG: hypothetical protein A2857_00615 [Candidatus Levybacteria bacterium RIFCSPHIGHO2_01_FULL_36_15]
MNKVLFAFLLAFIFTAETVFAGGADILYFEVSPQAQILNPGEQYIVHVMSYVDEQNTAPAKGWSVQIKLENPQESDYIVQNDKITNEYGRLYAKVISKIQGPRIVYADIIMPDGSIRTSKNKYVLNYYPLPQLQPSVFIEPTGSVIKSVNTVPSEINKISWRTNNVLLEADDFHIKVDGKKYIAKTNVNLHSDSSGAPYTTLEAIWEENGVEMRLFMYFDHRPGSFWRLYEVRTYNGQKPGDWIFYNPLDQFGQSIQNSIGYAYINNGSLIEFKPLSNSKYSGVIYFRNLRLQAFINNSNVQVTGTKKEPPVTVQQNSQNESNQNVDELNKKVSNLEQQLVESKRQQSSFEARLNSIVNFIKSIFPFFKN